MPAGGRRTSHATRNWDIALTKAGIVQALIDSIGITRSEAAEIVDAFFDELVSSLAAGSDVKLSGFGSFRLRAKPPRPGHNPKTVEQVTVTARRVATFHPNPKLKLKVGKRTGKTENTGKANEACSQLCDRMTRA
nr:integration host factor subunit alpha [Aromatoleum diolicum]